MASVGASPHSPSGLAKHRVLMADIDRVVAGGESRFPNGSLFVASDLVTDKKIREAHAVGQTVVVVDEHEHVTVLPAPDPSLGQREWDRFWRKTLAHW